MKTRRTIVLTALMALVVGACGTAASPSPSAPASAAPTASRRGIRRPRRPRPRPRRRAASPTPLPRRTRPRPSSRASSRARPSSSGRSTCRPRSTSTSRTRSPGSRRPIRASRSTWHDHQGTFKDDLNNAFAAGNAPDVINLSVSEGWVSEYAGKGLLLGLDTPVPQAVKDIYFPNLWKQQLIDGVNYQFPWYQGLNVELLNKALFEKAGVDRRRPSPRPSTACPALCKTFLDKARHAVRHPPDRQRPARPDGLRGQRQGLQRRRQVLRLQLARGRGVAADVRRHEHAPGRSTRPS